MKRKGIERRRAEERESKHNGDTLKNLPGDRGREGDIRRMIGYLVALSSTDWSLLLQVCDRASASEASAKEAAQALKWEFKYGEAPGQLVAGRLWAIMLRNSSELFITQCRSPKFLDAIEGLLSSSRTSPVVRERLLDVVSAAAYASRREIERKGFKALWKRVRPFDKPEEGVPFEVDDPMFNFPISGQLGDIKEHPSSGDIATNVMNHARTPTDLIPLELLDRKELPALPIPDWDDLKEDEPSPPSPSETSETESPTSDETESEWVHPPSQGAAHGTAPWILASRKLQVPKKSLDAEFMLHMTGLRRQIGASLRSGRSTLQTEQMSLILGSCVSLDSTAFSESFSVESLPLMEVEFPPTPVFTDEIPRGLINSNSTPRQLPTPPGLVRRGYWNRRGDHLTPDGCIVYPPLGMQYPEELKMYPFEDEGYQSHSGLFISYVRRPELPQSLAKHGKPPERPYESFVNYV
ncbi:hypothetical protein M413DRAFT_245421 [Hebeloma cylindrosporum]|uniref:VHS domain-containing protein n=1 Tax=Hebeloma cylindrosporum TaxID=76867 RepID=A0A0C3C457_HEBCY|nr:hypothetical protein M413DRAFT_245421 [Hebeloma cylindrosporum h7]